VALSITPITAVLSNPIVAALAGAVVGLVSFFASRASARLVAPEDPAAGFLRLAFVSTVRMLVTIGALTVFFYVARPGFNQFALALVGAFMLSLGYEVYRAAKEQRTATG
jgi:hypothetical protein